MFVFFLPIRHELFEGQALVLGQEGWPRKILLAFCLHIWETGGYIYYTLLLAALMRHLYMTCQSQNAPQRPHQPFSSL